MKIDIDYVSNLANLHLTDKEREHFKDQLKDILAFTEKLNEVDTSRQNPTYQVTGKENEMRSDIKGGSLPTKAAIANAPCKEGKMIATKGVFTDE